MVALICNLAYFRIYLQQVKQNLAPIHFMIYGFVWNWYWHDTWPQSWILNWPSWMSVIRHISEYIGGPILGMVFLYRPLFQPISLNVYPKCFAYGRWHYKEEMATAKKRVARWKGILNSKKRNFWKWPNLGQVFLIWATCVPTLGIYK